VAIPEDHKVQSIFPEIFGSGWFSPKKKYEWDVHPVGTSFLIYLLVAHFRVIHQPDEEENLNNNLL